nr:insulinase family protein [Vibrio brasiliensis]
MPTTKSTDEVSIRVRVGSGVAQEPSEQPLARIAALNTVTETNWLATSGYQQTVFSLDLDHGTDSDVSESLATIRHGLTKTLQQSQAQALLNDTFPALTDIEQLIETKQVQPLVANQEWAPLNEQSLVNTPAESVNQFQTNHYVPQNITLVMTGNIPPRVAARLIENNFSDWKSNTTVASNSLTELAIEPATTTVSSDSSLAISSLKNVRNLPDSKSLRKDMLVATLANKMLEQRIETALEQQHSQAKVAVDSQLVFNHKMLSQVRLTELAANEKENVEKVVQTEIQRAIAGGFTQTEYEMVVSQVRQQLESQTRLKNSHYTAQQADRLVEAVNSGSVYTAPSYDLDLLNFHVAHLNELDVSKELAKIWSQDDAVIL